jgi:hypothetical protein
MVLSHCRVYLSCIGLFFNRLSSIENLHEKVDGDAHERRMGHSHVEGKVEKLLEARGKTERESSTFVIAPHLLAVYYDLIDAKGEFRGRVIDCNLKLPNLEQVVILD